MKGNMPPVRNLMIFGLIALGSGCFAADRLQIASLLSQAHKASQRQDLESALSYYQQVLEQEKGNLDARIGELDIWAAWGERRLAEDDVAIIWQRLDKMHLVFVIRSLVSLYMNTGDLSHATFWLDALKELGGNTESVATLSKELAEQKNVFDSIGRPGGYDFFSTNRSFRKYAMLAFLRSLLSVNTIDLAIFSLPTANRLALSLGVIVRWEEVKKGIIVIEGFQPHSATDRALVLFDTTTHKGLILYWEIYHRLYTFGNSAGMTKNADVRRAIKDWQVALISQYSSKYQDAALYEQFDFVGF